MLKHNKIFELKEIFNNRLDSYFDDYVNKNINLDKLLFNAHSLANDLNRDISLLRKEEIK